jgi:GNAT superfamily N-acetyltransferase
MSEYGFRPYTEDDADAALGLFKSCFGKEKPRDEWLWNYHHAPYGQSSVVCSHGGEIVGFYGVVHHPLFRRGDEIAAGHVMDVMTHPNHQGKGLFVASAKAAFRNAREHDVGLFIGWPNKKAMPGHRKVGWKDLGLRRILRRNLRPGERNISQRDEYVTKEVSWKEMAASREEIDAIFAKSLSNQEFICDRRWDWLRWRYSARPGFSYRPALCTSVRNGDIHCWTVTISKIFGGQKVGHIVDLQSLPGDAGSARSALEWALKRFANEGCDYSQCLEGGPVTKGYDGWKQEPERELPFILRSTDDEGTKTPDTDLRDWYLTLGDCDVF